MTTKSFHLGDILSVTTGHLVSPSHMDGIYDVLNWMTGDDLMTHQLPRAADECEGALLAQHPDLAGIVVPGLDGKDAVDAWLAEQIALFGEYRDVAPLAPADHTRIDPIAELAMHYPNTQVIRVDGAS
jgi:hypothetical protein